MTVGFVALERRIDSRRGAGGCGRPVPATVAVSAAKAAFDAADQRSPRPFAFNVGRRRQIEGAVVVVIVVVDVVVAWGGGQTNDLNATTTTAGPG